MTDLNAIHEAVATDLLPDLPDAENCDNGYEWMAQLRGTGWTEVPAGPDGRLLGDWPFQIVAHHDDTSRDLYGLAVYTEGDVSVEGFRDRQARDTATAAYLEDGEDGE